MGGRQFGTASSTSVFVLMIFLLSYNREPRWRGLVVRLGNFSKDQQRSSATFQQRDDLPLILPLLLRFCRGAGFFASQSRRDSFSNPPCLD
jgi:hypothetical protein